jgi:uncharacterized protein (DUF952 family)
VTRPPVTRLPVTRSSAAPTTAVPVPRSLFHIATRADWEAAGDTYEPAAFAHEGFIHLSTAEQVARTAARFYSGVAGLVLLEIDGAAVAGELRWEGAHGELFPHLYAPLPRAAVVASGPFTA